MCAPCSELPSHISTMARECLAKFIVLDVTQLLLNKHNLYIGADRLASERESKREREQDSDRDRETVKVREGERKKERQGEKNLSS